ncbi:hypothetical protein Taro_052385 [Colocasia esculenta]|uniref:Uncharacterized protein n=1 Tax=Colocasia esculenta TaxID=4460 RepID=A0A843XJK5_COLES|nr:hypothetical protein [Colocasia esculenta]
MLLLVAFSPMGNVLVARTSNGVIYIGKKKTKKEETQDMGGDVDDGFIVEKRREKQALRPMNFRYFQRGQSDKPSSTDIVVKQRARVKLAEHDKILKKFEHREALVCVLEKKNPNTVVAVMQELVARRKLMAAVKTLDDEGLGLLLSFLHRNATLPRASRRREVTPPAAEEVPEVETEEGDALEIYLGVAAMARRNEGLGFVAPGFGSLPGLPWVSERERIVEMGFGEVLRMERMRADAPLTQALRSMWDTEVTAFVLPWGHMIPSMEDVSRITGLRVYGRPMSDYTYPCYQELARRLLDLTVEQRSSLLSRVELQESLGLFQTGKGVAETTDEQL